MQTLQPRVKWNKKNRNLAPGDIVLMVGENCARNEWPMARVISVNQDENSIVRSVKIRTKSTILERPISKLILLLEHE